MKHLKTIEDYLLDILKEGPLSIEELISTVGRKRKGATRQGVYRTLRVMKAREIVTVANKTVSLSSLWISKMQNYFTIAGYSYSQPTNDAGFLNMREGEKMTYSFRTLVELDVFWSHALYLFLEVLKNNNPVYIYNPHDWAYFMRKETDRILVEKSFATRRQIFIAVGHADPLDRIVKRNFDGTQGQYYLAKENFGFKENYYCNAIGDYMIEGFLSPAVAERLDSVYKNHSILDEKTMKEFQDVSALKGKNKLVISKNAKRAEKFRRILGRYFYIKK
ncbi:MAG: hypothetical protein JWM20_310 [Patescibacteria group bacterium]|nr:hypothetical protein [Patescibacteria group bacterium]